MTGPARGKLCTAAVQRYSVHSTGQVERERLLGGVFLPYSFPRGKEKEVCFRPIKCVNVCRAWHCLYTSVGLHSTRVFERLLGGGVFLPFLKISFPGARRRR